MKHLFEDHVISILPGHFTGETSGDDKVPTDGVDGYVREVAGMVKSPETVAPGQGEKAFFRLVANFGDQQDPVVPEVEIHAVIVPTGVADRATVIDTEHAVGFLARGLKPGDGTPGRDRIGGKPVRHVEEGGGRLPANSIGYKLAVIRRSQKITGRRETPVVDFETIPEKLVLHAKFDEAVGLAATEDLLHADRVSNCLFGQTVAGTLRTAGEERRLGDAQ